jgi:FAD/FMN-containing dehydrogenase
MQEEWSNWSGSVKFTPAAIEKPKNEQEVQQLVEKATADRNTIRIVGAGHSSVPLVKTEQILVSQEKLKGLVGYNMESMQVQMLPGTTIEEAGKILTRLRLDMHNTGDVDFQCLGGAFGTGTHGSGITLPNLSAMLVGCRLIDGRAQRHTYTLEEHPDMIRALRVSLGSLGFFTEVCLKTEPAEKHYRREFCTHITLCLEHLDELISQNEMFDFYWYPRNDMAKLRICNQLDSGMQEIPFATKVKDVTGWLPDILPNKRTLKYEEMEYAIPLEAGPDCFKEVRKRIKARHRHYVGWRVLYRTIAADDALLSPFYKQDSVTIAVLQNNELEYKKYFEDMEPIFREYGGRPHWGKKHSLKANDLAALYPEWERFLRIRQEMDPDGIFLNDYLKEIFGL